MGLVQHFLNLIKMHYGGSSKFEEDSRSLIYLILGKYGLVLFLGVKNMLYGKSIFMHDDEGGGEWLLSSECGGSKR